MNTSETNVSYVEWLNAKVMHEASRKWLSELKFMKDEQLFFDDLIRSYTLQLIDSTRFKESKYLVEKLSTIQKETEEYIKTVTAHENGLEVMVNDIPEPEEEEAYRKEHNDLIMTIASFLSNYRRLKSRLFSLIKEIIRDQKKKRLLQ
jgi:hypothetical protein